ncbi:MAG: Ig-like domain-containing protein [Gemmatimonadetes bacterium]|nr:Ig-like domain-containing protein [Gemmatimonadota bacterium]
MMRRRRHPGVLVCRVARLLRAAVHLGAVGWVLACGAPREVSGPAAVVSLRIPGEGQRLLEVGAAVQLSVVAVDAQGGEVLVRGTWTSSDAGVARVDAPGVVRAVGVGQATITVSHSGRAATVTVSTVPSGLRVRLRPDGAAVVVGETYQVVAEFLGSNGAVIAVPWDVRWDASDGAALSPGDEEHTMWLRVVSAGVLDLTARSGRLSATLRLRVLTRDEARLEVVSFTVWADSLAEGRMAFYPDLVVVAPLDVVVGRLDFVNFGAGACGSAPLARAATTPLFDFIPYDFYWRGAATAPRTPVEAIITYRHTDGSHNTARATGVVLMRPRATVIDYGTAGFVWNSC